MRGRVAHSLKLNEWGSNILRLIARLIAWRQSRMVSSKVHSESEDASRNGRYWIFRIFSNAASGVTFSWRTFGIENPEDQSRWVSSWLVVREHSYQITCDEQTRICDAMGMRTRDKCGNFSRIFRTLRIPIGIPYSIPMGNQLKSNRPH